MTESVCDSCLWQLAMGVLQVGFVVMYLSDTLVSGFTTAAAIHILVSQLKFVLGLEVPGISGPLSLIYVSTGQLEACSVHPTGCSSAGFILQTLEIIFNKITSTNVCDVVISIVIMVVVFIVKEINERFKSKLPVPIPIEVVMVSNTARLLTFLHLFEGLLVPQTTTLIFITLVLALHCNDCTQQVNNTH